jgi:hypothetical protein
MRSLKVVAKILLGVVLSGCVYKPTDGTLLQSAYEVVDFSGFTAVPKALVHIEAWDYKRLRYDSIAGTRASSTPIQVYGVTLYHWSVSTPIARTAVPSSLCRWDASCTLGHGDDGAKVRARVPVGGAMVLFTMDGNTFRCMVGKLSDKTANELGLAYALCKPEMDDAIRLHIIN